MTKNDPSPAFESILEALETRRRAHTEKRRTYTKNLVAQTNDEVRSGMPYLVDVAGILARANGAELFLDGLIISLRTDGTKLTESMAVKRALNAVLEQLKHLEPGDRTGYVTAADLSEIGSDLLYFISTVELKDPNS